MEKSAGLRRQLHPSAIQGIGEKHGLDVIDSTGTRKCFPYIHNPPGDAGFLSSGCSSSSFSRFSVCGPIARSVDFAAG